jgi:hypothetical protein
MVKAYAEAYNEIVIQTLSRNANNCQIRNNSKRAKNPSYEFVRFILKLCSEKANENEYSFDLIEELLTKFSIRSDDIFIHLGCSLGCVVLQIAAMVSCKKSIEIEHNSIYSIQLKQIYFKYKISNIYFSDVGKRISVFE